MRHLFFVLVVTAFGLIFVCSCQTAPQKSEGEQPVVEKQTLVQPEQQPTIQAPTQPEAVPPEPVPEQPEQKQPPKPQRQPEPKIQTPPQPAYYPRLNKFLKTYVNDKGLVNYKTLRPKRLDLLSVLDIFSQLGPNEYDRWTRNDKIAFWINAYNMFTVKVVIDHYPIKPSRFLSMFYPPNSIMQESRDMWTRFEFDVMGEKYTLREIERQILLAQFGDPRVCFALSYASLGGPVLRNEAYTGSGLDKQLDDQTGKFIKEHQGIRIDRKERKVYLSTILDSSWYAKSFVPKYGTDKKFKDKKPEVRAVLNFITGYLSRKDIDFLTRKNYSIKYTDYDWTLNE